MMTSTISQASNPVRRVGWARAPDGVAAGDGWPDMGVAAILRHLASIRALCDELDRPIDEIGAVYQCELRCLFEHAVVVDYLPVLVSKRVRRLFRRSLPARDQDEPCAPVQDAVIRRPDLPASLQGDVSGQPCAPLCSSELRLQTNNQRKGSIWNRLRQRAAMIRPV